MNEHKPWCCDGYAAFCPLCPRPTELVRCLGHAYTDGNREAVRVAQLHARHGHPDYEYRITNGPRKQWDASDVPPTNEDGIPEPGWERNVDRGDNGWERFDYHEEAYWRRPKPKRKTGEPCTRPECGGELHTDPWGTPVQCPHTEPAATDTGRRCPRCDCPDGHEQCDHCKVCPHAAIEEQSMGEPSESRPEPSGDDENPALPVRPDPRQPAYDAVYEYIRALGPYMPRDTVHRNAVIWRAVHAALGATPVGRCISSHCVEGGHILPVEGETP
ncbi:hypothetical protein [Streptomyces ipomoeae]|uniref:hypothetical protein n=1 Tax=Streptomyces ipomoeae TaxID=103232 RepID=UPI0029ABB4EE|nr:hypothetical protein [Streptomyces ipomoeae]MDX2697109.1 hypothetical protein [Streptomyces ipomoeae]